jgi:hypothetical protein
MRVPSRLTLPWLNVKTKIVLAACAVFSLLLVQSSNLPMVLALCYVLALMIAGFLYFKLSATGHDEATFLPKLFLAAFAVRVVAAIGISLFAKGFVAYDALTYEAFGLDWSNYWHHLSISQPKEYLPSMHLFDTMVGAQYFVSDNNTFVPDITNAFVGTLIPTIIYKIGREYLGGNKVGQSAAVFATLQTACVIWSAIAMRDIFILFFVTLVLQDLIRLIDRLTWAGALRILMWLGCIYLFRPYIVLIMLAAIGVTVTLAVARRPLVRFVIGFVCVVAVGSAVFVGGFKAVAQQVIENQTEQLSSSRSAVVYKEDHAYAPNVKYTSATDVLEFLPIGLFYFWAGPILFGFGIRQIIFGLPEVISWYVTFWYGFRGFLALRGRNRYIVPLLAYFLIGSLLLAAICGNFAESIRLRSMLSVPLELFAGVGWFYRKQRLSFRVAKT